MKVRKEVKRKGGGGAGEAGREKINQEGNSSYQ